MTENPGLGEGAGGTGAFAPINFPQAFTHLPLINAVMHVIRAEQGAAGFPFLGSSARTDSAPPVGDVS